jgi:hypothetical protein
MESKEEYTLSGILEKLNYWAVNSPETKAWTFLNDKGDPNDSYTFRVITYSVAVCEFNLFSCVPVRNLGARDRNRLSC